MNSTTKDFVEFLKKIDAKKTALIELLEVERNRAFAYFIAPIENIVKIFNSGGIRPRKFVTNVVDVSSNIIQELRNSPVQFSDHDQSKNVDLHECVNLFLNPINYTLYQFRRNALIQHSTRNQSIPIIGILEIDLEALLLKDGVYWKIFPTNFIKTVNSSSHDYRNFNWSNIYELTTKTTKENRNLYQFAEIIVHNSMDPLTISKTTINRVLVFRGDIPSDSNPLLSKLGFNMKFFSDNKGYSALDNRLNYDRRFLGSLYVMTNQGKKSDLVVNCLSRLVNIEEEISLSLMNNYVNNNVAIGREHGFCHTIRVMFWVLYLAAEVSLRYKDAITEEELRASLYAAFIHDLCRSTNQVDTCHGESAANQFSQCLQNHLRQPYLTRCLNAVKAHSKPNDPEEKDIVWILLKDADAIDRSRFAPPGEPAGCQIQYLRLNMLKKDSNFANVVLWTSYFFSRLTNYVNWTDYSCRSFVVTILGCLHALRDSQDIPYDHKLLAGRIIQGVEVD